MAPKRGEWTPWPRGSSANAPRGSGAPTTPRPLGFRSLELDEGLLVEPENAVHDTLTGLVEDRSSLMEDRDGDREVSDDERNAAVATGERDPEGERDE